MVGVQSPIVCVWRGEIVYEADRVSVRPSWANELGRVPLRTGPAVTKS